MQYLQLDFLHPEGVRVPIGRILLAFGILAALLMAWKFNQLASELAFHRSRVSRGIRSRNQDPEAQEAAYLHALHDLVNELRVR